jgi:hypothetical protein
MSNDARGTVELVVPLDRLGQSPTCTPYPPKKRIIDLRAGDEIHHRPTDQTSHRENWSANLPESQGEGYVVRGKPLTAG